MRALIYILLECKNILAILHFMTLLWHLFVTCHAIHSNCDVSHLFVTRLTAVFVAENQIWHETRLSFLTSFVPVMFSSDSVESFLYLGENGTFLPKFYLNGQLYTGQTSTSAVAVKFLTIVSLRMWLMTAYVTHDCVCDCILWYIYLTVCEHYLQ